MCAQALQARADLGEDVRNRRRLLHTLTLLARSRKQQRKWRPYLRPGKVGS